LITKSDKIEKYGSKVHLHLFLTPRSILPSDIIKFSINCFINRLVHIAAALHKRDKNDAFGVTRRGASNGGFDRKK